MRNALLCALFVLMAPLSHAQISLPVTFEEDIDYELTDFGGNMSQLVADPEDAENTVVASNRMADAECFAGTTVAESSGFTPPIPFSEGNLTMSVRVWSPEAGVRVLFKVEEVGVPEINAETFTFTTVAMQWETLVFDFANPMPNTNPINFDNTYDKASIFFDFQCNLPPTASGPGVYYWDDVAFGGEVDPPDGIALPITFEDDIDYELVDFGGNMSQLVADPTDVSNTVVESIRTAGAEFFAGTTVADASGFDAPIPFSEGNTAMTVRVWTPSAGTPVRLKVEKFDDPTVSVEAEVTSTLSGMWETLTFDFVADQVPDTAPINFASVYNKASVFFNFGEEGAATPTTYYWDDVAFGGGGNGGGDDIELPITFEEEIDYELRDFGGNASTLVADPEDAANTVVESVRTAGAAFFAGTAVADLTGLAEPIPFASGMTTMNVRVWSPEAGIPVRLKVENVDDPGVSAETETTTTSAMAWETIVFDFADEVTGTPPLNLDASYGRVVIFFNFGQEGAATPTTYYWDDVAFGGEGGGGDDIALPVTFEDDIDYELVDFGGAMSQLVTDPEDAENTVVASNRTADAECFAGTTVANASGFAEPIPFAPGDTKMNVRVWSPEAGVRVLFKVEEVGVPEINAETFTFTTVAMQWETIVFDFGNPMPNTNPINFDNTYDKASIFFDFQCNLPPTASGPGVYYWDDVAFGDFMPVASEDGSGVPLALELAQNYPNPFYASTTISFSLPSAEYVGVYVYNVLGQRVATLVEETMDAGDHALSFDASGLASGTYFYRLNHGAGSLTRSMVLTR